MPKHQAAACPKLSRNETLAPGFIATYNKAGKVIAVHTFGLSGQYSSSHNRPIRNVNQ